MAQIDPRIALQALPRRNALDYAHGFEDLRQKKRQGKQQENALAMQAGTMLARGVLSAEDPAAAYPLALQQAQRFGMDVSSLPPEWGPEAEVATRMFAEPGKAPVFQQKIGELMSNGLPRDMAAGIVLGRYVTSRHPVTGVATVIDKASGQTVGQIPSGDGAGAPAGGGYGGAAQGGRAVEERLAGLDDPVQRGGAQQQTGFGVAGEVPEEEGDYPSAFGAKGIWTQLANVASDFVGAGQVYPDAATARRQIENLNAQTATLLAEGTETRGGKYLIDRFDEIQAEAGGIQGPEDALKTLEEIQGLLARAYEINQSIAQSEVKPSEKSAAVATMRRLEPMLQEYDAIIGTFQQQYYGPQGGHPRNTQPRAGSPNRQVPRLGIDVTMEDLKSGDRVMTPDGKIRIVP